MATSIDSTQTQSQLNAHQVDRILKGRSITAQSAESDAVNAAQAAAEQSQLDIGEELGVASSGHLDDANAKAKEIADHAIHQSQSKTDRSNASTQDRVTLSDAAKEAAADPTNRQDRAQRDDEPFTAPQTSSPHSARAIESSDRMTDSATQHVSSAVDRARAQRSAAAHAEAGRDPAAEMAQRIEQRRIINEAAQPDHRIPDESFSLHI